MRVDGLVSVAIFCVDCTIDAEAKTVTAAIVFCDRVQPPEPGQPLSLWDAELGRDGVRIDTVMPDGLGDATGDVEFEILGIDYGKESDSALAVAR
jgi:hypothetical protein